MFNMEDKTQNGSTDRVRFVAELKWQPSPVTRSLSASETTVKPDSKKLTRFSRIASLDSDSHTAAAAATTDLSLTKAKVYLAGTSSAVTKAKVQLAGTVSSVAKAKELLANTGSSVTKAKVQLRNAVETGVDSSISQGRKITAVQRLVDRFSRHNQVTNSMHSMDC